MTMEDYEENRKEVRKNHLEQKNKKKGVFDDEVKFANKSKKVRKYRLEALQAAELEEEWEDYFK
jgi:hypothetical protein